MGTVDLDKLFNKVYEEDHHNLELLIKIFNERVSHYGEEKDKRMFQKVIYDCSWSAEEKAELLLRLDIGCYERKLRINNDKVIYDFCRHALMFKNETGLKALILWKLMLEGEKDLSIYFASIFQEISERTQANYQKDISGDYTYIYGPEKELRNKGGIFNSIRPGRFTHKDEVSYMKLVLSVIPDEMLHKLINEKVEIINSIINTQNFKFIDQNISLYKGDISVFLPAAVETGNLDLVKHLISKGANPNYQYASGTFSPIEMAVICNYNHILKYLIECGASIDNKRKHDQLLSPTEMSYFLTKSRSYYGYGFECYYTFMRPRQGSGYVNTYDAKYSRSSFIDVPKISIKRTEIVHTCFENSSYKNTLDYTSILITSIFSLDTKYIHEYTKYIRENNIDIDLFKILDFIEISNIKDEKETIQYLKNYILPCCLNSTEKIAKYLNKIVTSWPEVSNAQEAGQAIESNVKYIDILLDFVSEEDKKNVILVPYVRNVENLKVLLKHGFDVNQKDNNGNTLLINLFSLRNVSYDFGDFTDKEYKLFQFLTKIDPKTNEPFSDVTICNDKGYNALATGIKYLHMHDEMRKAQINNTNERTKMEKALVKLVTILPRESVDIDSVHEMLERRCQYPDIYPNKEFDGLIHEHGKLWANCIYQNHCHLFTELKRKMNFRKEFSHVIFDEYFNVVEGIFGILSNIDYDKTEEFLYSYIDDDNEIQRLSIKNVFNDLSKKISNASYDEYLVMLHELSDTARTLADFYEQHISKKINKDKYLEFVTKKYDTKYNVSQHYLIQFICIGIKKFGIDKLGEMLLACPQFDRNKIQSFTLPTNFASIYSANFEFVDDDGNPCRRKNMFYPKIADKFFWDLCDDKTHMTGTLMSYAILLNDIDLVKKLEELGFDFYPECDDDVDIVWDYVTSPEMKEYLETKVGPQFYAGLNVDEIAYITGKKPRSRKEIKEVL